MSIPSGEVAALADPLLDHLVRPQPHRLRDREAGHIVAMRFMSATQTDMLTVPFKGTPKPVIDRRGPIRHLRRSTGRPGKTRGLARPCFIYAIPCFLNQASIRFQPSSAASLR